MKKRVFGIVFLLSIGLSVRALAQDFSTGSSMMNTGSAYSSNVYGVGATSVDPMSCGDYATNYSAGRKSPGGVANPGEQSNQSPIGSTTALLIFAGAAAGAVALRKRKEN